MNLSVKITIYLILIGMLIMVCIPIVVHAESPSPQSYFSDSDVKEVVEIWNKFGEVVHTIYYNSKPFEWFVVGTCPYYPNSPEHRVFQAHYYPDGSQTVVLDYRDTGDVDAEPPDREEYSQTLQEETQKLIDSGIEVDNISDTQDIVNQIHQENVIAQTGEDVQIIEPKPSITAPPEPTKKVEPTPIPEPIMYELIVEYNETKGTVDGEGSYEENTQIDLIAEPNEGYEVDYWIGIDGDNFVVLDDNRVVKVCFKAIESDPTEEPTDDTAEEVTAEEDISETNVQEEMNENHNEITEETTNNEIKAMNQQTKMIILCACLIVCGSLIAIMMIRKKKMV